MVNDHLAVGGYGPKGGARGTHSRPAEPTSLVRPNCYDRCSVCLFFPNGHMPLLTFKNGYFVSYK